MNSAIQIIGDGGYSQLTWTGAVGGGPVIRLLGPSKAILRDFIVEGYNSRGNSAAAIEVDNADQAGSRVFMEQTILSRSQPNLFVDGLDYTNVELHDFSHLTAPPNATSINVVGGPSAAAGLWQGGATNIFAGSSTENYISYGVSNGAHVAVQTVWNDAGPGQAGVANITGTSTFTYAGSLLALPSGSALAVALANFQGTAAFLNLNTNGDIDITGNGGAAQVLGLGLVGPSTTFFSNTSSPAAASEFLNGQADPNPGIASPTELPEIGAAAPTFLTATLNQIRTAQPTLLAPLASGVTDARFYRVSVDDFITGIHLEAGSVGAAVNGSCGASNGADLTSAPTTGLCTAGTSSSVAGSGPWAWSCTGSNGGGTASCSASLALPPVNGACGASNGSLLTSAPTTGLCTAGTASTISGSGPWTWSCAGSNGGTTQSCSALFSAQKVDGNCGQANGHNLTSAPAANLCNSGTASAVSGTGPWSWSCTGLNGGHSQQCSAQLDINGACGSANGVAASLAPSSGLCAAGAPSGVGGGGNNPWQWNCNGSNGGQNASCSAPLIVNGQCGNANGADLNNAPGGGNLCNSGTASAVNGSGPWTWSCMGSNGGGTQSCSALLQANGQCGPANGGHLTSAPTGATLCNTGTASSVVFSSNNGQWNWSCAGSNGGNAQSCSAQLEINGVCGSANGVAASQPPSGGLCAAGQPSGVGGGGNNPWQWNCNGSNGGQNASCSAPSP